MSEDRTQAPTKRRWQQAREHGLAPHSPELTAAAALLGAALALVLRGEALAVACLELMRAPFRDAASLVVAVDASTVTERIRDLGLAVASPLLTIFAAAFLAALLAHEAQVLGLWAPGLLAPDPSRLWAVGRGPGATTRAGRGVWSLLKGLLVMLLAAWILRAGWIDLQRLGGLETSSLVREAGRSLGRLMLVMGAATLLLGLVDFALTWFRFETMLRMSPEEAREDMRSVEGDPALRARRRHLARSLRSGAEAELTGARLVLTGASGLTIVLGGGPPPRVVRIRAIQTGAAGERLRKEAEAANLDLVDAPRLARRLARRRPANLPPTGELLDELALLWPGRAGA